MTMMLTRWQVKHLCRKQADLRNLGCEKTEAKAARLKPCFQWHTSKGEA